MTDNKRILEALTKYGWTADRSTEIPKIYEELGCSELSKKIISNLYNFKINFRTRSEEEGSLYLTEFNSNLIKKDYFESEQEEFKEITGIEMKVYSIGMRDDGYELYIDNYGNFFGDTTVDIIEYLGNGRNMEEVFSNILLHKRSAVFVDGECYDKDGGEKILNFDPKVGIIK